MTAFGTFPGIFFQNYLNKSTGKTVYNLMILTFCIFLAAISTLGINIPHTIHQNEIDGGVMSITPYCIGLPEGN